MAFRARHPRARLDHVEPGEMQKGPEVLEREPILGGVAELEAERGRGLHQRFPEVVVEEEDEPGVGAHEWPQPLQSDEYVRQLPHDVHHRDEVEASPPAPHLVRRDREILRRLMVKGQRGMLLARELDHRFAQVDADAEGGLQIGEVIAVAAPDIKDAMGVMSARAPTGPS
jgi:hypothetical protein